MCTLTTFQLANMEEHRARQFLLVLTARLCSHASYVASEEQRMAVLLAGCKQCDSRPVGKSASMTNWCHVLCLRCSGVDGKHEVS